VKQKNALQEVHTFFYVEQIEQVVQQQKTLLLLLFKNYIYNKHLKAFERHKSLTQHLNFSTYKSSLN
jgi:hypothetical protein